MVNVKGFLAVSVETRFCLCSLKLLSNRKMIQEINWQRKNMQTQGGEKLRQLEAQWVGLVSKNYEIEQACVQLEKEVARLKMADKNS